MNSVWDQTRLAGKRYKVKVKKDNHQLQEPKLQKKQYELSKRRAFNRKQSESNNKKENKMKDSKEERI